MLLWSVHAAIDGNQRDQAGRRSIEWKGGAIREQQSATRAGARRRRVSRNPACARRPPHVIGKHPIDYRDYSQTGGGFRQSGGRFDSNRPPLPLFTYPDAFSALAFLRTHPNIASDRIGVLGFSWGGVISVASAEQLYAGLFGGDGGPRFKAHVAHYPTCYVFNKQDFPPTIPPPAKAGTQFLNLTGAPVLIQIGTEDDYDNGAGPCRNLADTVNPSNNNLVEVAVYEGAYHAWDRIMIPITVSDPFGNEGSFFETGIIPQVEIRAKVDAAYEARQRVVSFFRRSL